MAITGFTDTMYAGNKHVLRFTIVDQDVDGSTAKIITGKIIKFALARVDTNGNPIVASPILTKTTVASGGIVITDGNNGICEVAIETADTSNSTLGDFYGELEVFSSTGTDPVVVATGTLSILPNVVNP